LVRMRANEVNRVAWGYVALYSCHVTWEIRGRCYPQILHTEIWLIEGGADRRNGYLEACGDRACFKRVRQAPYLLPLRCLRSYGPAGQITN
jgi:hypothetical protein